jgi:hypothetical protein
VTLSRRQKTLTSEIAELVGLLEEARGRTPMDDLLARALEDEIEYDRAEVRERHSGVFTEAMKQLSRRERGIAL